MNVTNWKTRSTGQFETRSKICELYDIIWRGGTSTSEFENHVAIDSPPPPNDQMETEETNEYKNFRCQAAVLTLRYAILTFV